MQREVEGYGLVQPGREECGGDLIAVLNYPKRRIFTREDGVRLISAQVKEEKQKEQVAIRNILAECKGKKNHNDRGKALV